MIGKATSDLLDAKFGESFKREVDADEAIWRSLPFFAAVIGLVVAVMPVIYRSIATTPSGWRTVSLTLFATALISFGSAGYWFWSVIRLREYVYPPPDREILDYAIELDAFYAAQGNSALHRDDAVANDLRVFLIDQYAGATTNNRRHNNQKAAARSQVLLFVMAGFLLAFLSEATILGPQALSGISRVGQQGDRDDQANRRGTTVARQATDSAGSRTGSGRREHQASVDAAGHQTDRRMSDEKPTPTPPPLERPRPPEPERLKKNEEIPNRRS